MKTNWKFSAAYIAFGAGAVLAAITLVQLISTIRILDNPLTGMIGFWLLALVLHGLGRRELSEDRPVKS